MFAVHSPEGLQEALLGGARGSENVCIFDRFENALLETETR